MTALRRIIKAGFINFWRNGSVSFSAVLVMVVALFMIGSTLLLTAFLGTALKDLEAKIDINIYIATNAEESSIIDLKNKLESLPQVETITYISREKALENFRARHKDDSRIMQALNEVEGNPLTAVLNVKAKEPSQYEGIANFLDDKSVLSTETLSIVSKVNYNDNKVVIDRLTGLITGIQKFASIVTAVMIGISILITFNTIRLAIFISRYEIAVMRLVGGDRGYIRGPFIVEGVLYGLMAGAFTIILFYPITYWLKGATQGFYGGINLLQYFVANFIQIFFIIMLSGVALGAISSYLAVRKYLTSK